MWESLISYCCIDTYLDAYGSKATMLCSLWTIIPNRLVLLDKMHFQRAHCSMTCAVKAQLASSHDILWWRARYSTVATRNHVHATVYVVIGDSVQAGELLVQTSTSWQSWSHWCCCLACVCYNVSTGIRLFTSFTVSQARVSSQHEQYVISRYRVCLRVLRCWCASVLHSHAAQCDTGADWNN